MISIILALLLIGFIVWMLKRGSASDNRGRTFLFTGIVMQIVCMLVAGVGFAVFAATSSFDAGADVFIGAGLLGLVVVTGIIIGAYRALIGTIGWGVSLALQNQEKDPLSEPAVTPPATTPTPATTE